MQAAALDFSTLKLLDKEFFTDVPQGQQRRLDIVAEVADRHGSPRLVLLHIETQREKKEEFPARMMRYGMMLHLRYPDHLILPLAQLHYPSGEGIGQGHCRLGLAEFTAIDYHDIEISLPLLVGAEWVERPEPLAALMQVENWVGLYRACLHRLTELEQEYRVDEARLFLLQNLVRTYLPLTKREQAQVLEELRTEGAMLETELTWADRMRLEGIAEGRLEGEIAAILALLQDRFDTIPETVIQRVQASTEAEAVRRLLLRAVHITEPEQLFE